MLLQWDYPRPYLFQTTVADADIDALGHTNNAVYTGWCEQAAWAHSGVLGLDADDYNRLQRAMAIQQANYQYLAPGFAGDAIVVATWLTACDGRLTMERSFQINNKTTGKCLFRGSWQLVCINLVSNKPARIPDEFKAVYMPHIISPPEAG